MLDVFKALADFLYRCTRIHGGFHVLIERSQPFQKDALGFSIKLFLFLWPGWCVHTVILPRFPVLTTAASGAIIPGSFHTLQELPQWPVHPQHTNSS